MLATRNFSRGRFDQFDAVSGETLAEEHLVRNGGCTGCPVHCGREVILPEKAGNGRRKQGTPRQPAGGPR